MRILGGLISLVVLLALAGGGAALWLRDRVERPGPLADEVVVEIADGSSVGAIAGVLERAGAIADARLFEIAVRVIARGETLKAGEYALPAGASVADLVARLVAGRTLVHRLTVPEGLTSAEIVALLREAEALSGEIAEVPAEGSLLPETYHYSRGDRREAMLGRMAKAREETIAELWAGRAENLPFDTPEQALILASIVEKETALADERAHVAGVFVNRLARRMRLQSDPTVIYALTAGEGALGRVLTHADLDLDHPFNTYRIDGLPPAPIANPGRDSIAAVLNPLETEDLYFVADGSGGHVFARTLNEHNRNVAARRREAASGD
jgi:UPF0755 protein